VLELREEIGMFLERGTTAKEQEFNLEIMDYAFILKLA
jgi:hypothetical protein